MEVTLFDTMERVALYPFTEIRAVADLRTGLYTLRERWAHFFRQPVHVATALYLSRKYEPAPGADHLYINAATFPDPAFCTALQQLQPGHLLVHGDTVIALRTNHHPTFGFAATDFPAYRVHAFQPAHSLLRYPFQLTQWNGYWLEQDFRQVTYNRRSEPLPACAQVTGNGPIFVEPGAVLEHCFINTQQGPVYIGAGSSVLDGSCIRGPFALLKQGVVKMGALIYGATTIGAHSVAGGEIKNSILFDAANKAHEGYLGDAVVGSWCNLGAGTSCSNLKNTAAEVKIWNKHLHQWIPAGSKCGVMLGDYPVPPYIRRSTPVPLQVSAARCCIPVSCPSL